MAMPMKATAFNFVVNSSAVVFDTASSKLVSLLPSHK